MTARNVKVEMVTAGRRREAHVLGLCAGKDGNLKGLVVQAVASENGYQATRQAPRGSHG